MECNNAFSNPVFSGNAKSVIYQINTCNYWSVDHNLHLATILSLNCFSACPDRKAFLHPPIFLLQEFVEPGNQRVYNGKRIELSTPGNVIILVTIPAANPPVICDIYTSTLSRNCSGSTDNETLCTVTLAFEYLKMTHVAVEMTYIALEPSTTMFSVQLNGKCFRMILSSFELGRGTFHRLECIYLDAGKLEDN